MGSQLNSNFANGSKPVMVRDASDEPSKKSVAAAARQPDPAGARFLSSIHRAQAVAAQRRQALLRFNVLKKSHGGTKAARMVGSSIPTLWRWQKQFSRRGLAGLQPKNFKCGRRSAFKQIRFTVHATRELERLIAQRGSPRAAWRQFALSPVCPPLIARQVQRTGKAPAVFASVGQLSAVQARVMISADGRRLFVKLPSKGTVTTCLTLPPQFKPVRASA